MALWNSEDSLGTVEAVARWAGITGAFFTVLMDNFGADADYVGFGYDRSIAALTEKEEQDVFSTLSVGRQPLKKLQLGKLRAPLSRRDGIHPTTPTGYSDRR